MIGRKQVSRCFLSFPQGGRRGVAGGVAVTVGSASLPWELIQFLWTGPFASIPGTRLSPLFPPRETAVMVTNTGNTASSIPNARVNLLLAQRFILIVTFSTAFSAFCRKVVSFVWVPIPRNGTRLLLSMQIFSEAIPRPIDLRDSRSHR